MSSRSSIDDNLPTRGETEAVEAVVELVKAGANLDLQDKVHCVLHMSMQREL